MSCPKCGSDNWKMASVVHAEGLSHVSASNFGVGVGNVLGEDIFAGAANVGGLNGEIQTRLSKLASPPSFEANNGCILQIIGFITIILGVSYDKQFVFYIGLLVFFSSIRFIFGEKAKEYKNRHKMKWLEYEKKKICLRCGTLFFEETSLAVQNETDVIKVNDMKKCPYCAEEVKAEAIRCKHCRSDIESV